MGKVVLGIVAVFVLDLAFILFIKGGGDVVELSRAIRLASVDPTYISQEVQGPEIALSSGPDEDIYAFPVPETHTITPAVNRDRSSVTHIRSDKKTDVRRTIRNPRLSPYTAKTGEPFTDTVIVIERASYVPQNQIDRAENPPIKAIQAASPNFAPVKRSFFSRAGLIVRKPYDWTKTLASKLF